MDQQAESDAILLKRFVEGASQEAFQQLVERHNQLVLGVCERVLGDNADPEEAAQATFIALALKANRLEASTGIGGWLHHVARQISIDLRKAAIRRQHRDQEAFLREAIHREAPPVAVIDWAADLDNAVAALPERIRIVVIEHYLQGFSLEQLATRHRCTLSAISMRLTRGRQLLRKRLTKRGFSIGILSGVMIEGVARAGIQPTGFSADTARLAERTLVGMAATEHPTIRLMKLAHSALRKLLFARLKWVAAGGITAGVFALTASVGAKPPQVVISAPPPVAAVPSAGPSVTPTPSPIQSESETTPQDPPLIAQIKKVEEGWPETKRFKELMDAQRGKLNAVLDSGRRTPLHWAVKEQKRDYVTLLMINGANVDAVDAADRTPLFEAVDIGAKWLQWLLVLRGADINHVANDGSTPLSHALALGNLDSTELLLWLGAPTRLENVPEAQQPLALAKAGGNSAVLELLQGYENPESPTLQKQPRYVPTFVKNSLHDAAGTADFQKLDAFLQGGANIDLRDDAGQTALYRAIQGNHEDVVFYLLMLGSNPNAADNKGATPFMYLEGWLGDSFNTMRQCLLVRGARPYAVRKDGFDELTWAIERDNETGTQWMLWLGINGHEWTKRGTPFQIAFQGGHQRIMEVLRLNGIDEPVKMSDDPVWNLHNAVKRGDAKMVTDLLEQGVPVDAPDKDGNTPLIISIGTRNTPISKLLIQRGANINFQNPKSGLTPLLQTICWDYGDMTEMREDLLKAGVNPNACYKNSATTALMQAVYNYPTVTLKQLIKYGADLNLRDKDGRTALGYAIKRNSALTADYLKQLGAVE